MEAITLRYLEWNIGEFEKASGFSRNPKDYLSKTLDNLDDYMQLDGRFAMAGDETGTLLGLILLKRLSENSGEIN
ncbi:MAG: hypothetical protein AB8B71_00810 [Paracoccaceae bacterium]